MNTSYNDFPFKSIHMCIYLSRWMSLKWTSSLTHVLSVYHSWFPILVTQASRIIFLYQNNQQKTLPTLANGFFKLPNEKLLENWRNFDIPPLINSSPFLYFSIIYICSIDEDFFQNFICTFYRQVLQEISSFTYWFLFHISTDIFLTFYNIYCYKTTCKWFSIM